MEPNLTEINTQKSNSLFIAIIISIVLTAIVVGGGVYWWISQNQQVSVTKNSYVTSTPKSNLEAYQARQDKIAELKANPQLTVDDIYDLQSVISFSEWKDLFETARKQVIKGSVEGMDFDLVFRWKKGNWVFFSVIPENVEADIAQLYLEKTDSGWQAYGPGTAFQDLYEKHPDLFK